MKRMTMNRTIRVGTGKKHCRLITIALLTSGALGLAVGTAGAQEQFPSKPVHIISPYGAGPTDITARIFGEALSGPLGVPVIVENRSGASGRIGMDAIKEAGPDGYNIYVATPYQAVILPIVFEGNSPLKTFRQDFRTVGLANAYDLVINTGTASNVQSIRDLVAKARAGTYVTYVSTGAASLTDLVFEGIAAASKVKFTPVVYRGSGTALPDLIGGRVTVAVDAPASIIGQIKEGRIRALASTGTQRSNQLPDVPSLAEIGMPELAKLDFRVWNAFFVPAQTPEARVVRLNEALRKAAEDTKLKGRFYAGGYEVLAGATLAQAKQFLDQKYQAWQPLLKQMGVKVTE